MSNDSSVSRREFFRAGAAAAAAAAALPAVAGEERNDGPNAGPVELPTRKLGRTGVDVTILSQGAGFAINNRHMNVMHSMGVRCIDTAKYYLKGASERAIGDWFKKTGHRKEYFLVTKDVPLEPGDMAGMIDERLENLQTDYIDLFFLHGMGDSDHYHGLDDVKWFSDPAWLKAVEKIRASGKCRFFGFSTHTRPIEVRTGMLAGAARGGWVDAIMVGTDPVVMKENAEFNKAIDACHRAGIGLISMKENLGKEHEMQEKAGKALPGFKDKGLSPYTAILSAMWTDERFACVCSHMDNLEKLRENATACRNFKPLGGDELAAVDDLIRRSKRTFCVACDGSCQRAAGTRADLNTLARYVTYAEADGRVYEARELLAAMPPEARDCTGADLKAARRACKCNVDFAAVVKRAEELLA